MGKSLESWDFSAPFLGQLLMAKRAAEYRQLWESKLGNQWESGWWLSPTPLKNDGVRQSWDYCSQYMEK